MWAAHRDFDAGQSGSDGLVDFDGNRTVNVLDFTLLAANFLKSGA